MAADDECDDLFALLQECSQNLLGGLPLTEDSPALPVPAAASPATAATTAQPAGRPKQPLDREQSPSSHLVGASPEELDSIKELIHFDHVYYKQEDGGNAGTADIIMEDVPATVAATAAVNPQDLPFPASSHASVVTTAPASPASVVEVEDTVVIIEDSSSPAPSDNSAHLNLDFTTAGRSDLHGCGLSGETLSIPSPPVSSAFSMVPSPSALSTETGYESAVSPLSDCSFKDESLFSDSPWEDPLSELFPALV